MPGVVPHQPAAITTISITIPTTTSSGSGDITSPVSSTNEALGVEFHT